MKGSRTALSGSGMSTMSDSWMPFQPAMDEPSNILPSSKNPSSTILAGTLTCCSFPRVSVKRRSMNFTSFSAIVFNTSSADISGILLWSMGLRFRRGERYEAASGCTLRASPSDPGPRAGLAAPGIAAHRGFGVELRRASRRRNHVAACGAHPSEGPRHPPHGSGPMASLHRNNATNRGFDSNWCVNRTGSAPRSRRDPSSPPARSAAGSAPASRSRGRAPGGARPRPRCGRRGSAA